MRTLVEFSGWCLRNNDNIRRTVQRSLSSERRDLLAFEEICEQGVHELCPREDVLAAVGASEVAVVPIGDQCRDRAASSWPDHGATPAAAVHVRCASMKP